MSENWNELNEFRKINVLGILTYFPFLFLKGLFMWILWNNSCEFISILNPIGYFDVIGIILFFYILTFSWLPKKHYVHIVENEDK